MVWPFLLDGAVKNDISARDEKQPPAGRPPNRSPAQRGRFGSEEILNRAQFSPQGGNGAVLRISELVEAGGVEPLIPGSKIADISIFSINPCALCVHFPALKTQRQYDQRTRLP